VLGGAGVAHVDGVAEPGAETLAEGAEDSGGRGHAFGGEGVGGCDDAGGGELREGAEGDGGFGGAFGAAVPGAAGDRDLSGRWAGMGCDGLAGNALHRGLGEGEQREEGCAHDEHCDSEEF